MLHDQLRRDVAEPFSQRDLFVSGGAEHLQELQNVTASILDVVAEIFCVLPRRRPGGSH